MFLKDFKRGSQFAVLITILLLNFLLIMLYTGIIGSPFTTTNIYIISVIAFVSMFCVLIMAFRTVKDVKNTSQIDGSWRSSFGIVSFLIGLILIVHYFLFAQFTESEIEFELGNFIHLPKGLWIGVGIIAVALCYFRYFHANDTNKYCKWLVYSMSVIMVFWGNLILNPFTSTYIGAYVGDISRSTYLTETIYNVLDGVPYTIDTSGLYGHYGLFFIPLKVLDGKMCFYAIAVSFSIFACIEQIALIYIVDSFCKTNWLCIILCLGGCVRWSSYCPAIYPLRPLFPMLLFALFVYMKKRNIILSNQPIKIALLGLFLTASALWNLETGLVCIVGSAIYMILEEIYINDDLKFRILIKKVLGVSVWSAFIIALYVLVINAYNLCCGGIIIGRECFYPLLFGEGDIVETVREWYGKPPIGNHAWEYIIAFSLMMVTVSWHEFQMKKRKAIIMIVMSFIVILLMTYYMNESLWNCLMPIKQVLFGVFAGFIECDGEEKDFKRRLWYTFRRPKNTVTLLMITVIVCYAVQIINDPIRIASMSQAGARNTKRMEADIDSLGEELPLDTYGVGMGVNIIYHILERDNHAKFRDTSALDFSSAHTYSNLMEEVLDSNSVLISSHMYDDIIRQDLINNGYRKQQEFLIYGAGYEYYIRTKE